MACADAYRYYSGVSLPEKTKQIDRAITEIYRTGIWFFWDLEIALRAPSAGLLALGDIVVWFCVLCSSVCVLVSKLRNSVVSPHTMKYEPSLDSLAV